MNKKKRGVSPIIATVLLISIVVVLALIIFLWFRGMTEEAVTKFGGTNVDLVCPDVKFEASYYGGLLSVSNIGTVPIYNMEIEVKNEGEYETIYLSKSASWKETGLNPGETFSANLDSIGDPTELILIPVLMGESESGQKTATCDKQYGLEIEAD